ncbi:uncharacterized protein EDB91DRAFT_80539 [Suillus paluster]|uniref:uncharacterized protein n=1 Tax=Suillus paluster TaxID=48578 RepID=UPI001B872381|nr:uncharacterized protein EDB91DRAFT_80539 [Suillus paluster]KAG1725884.1 hypothetical protein EDB91DRAFT_80539 [Suillus paluster]
MHLSLSSPSIQKLGEDARRVLAIIAFLPQGLHDDLASDLLPSLPQADTICDVLCRQSLVYRQDSFIKMLAPIRYYVQDSLPPPDPISLQEIRAFYYHTIEQCSRQRDNYADIVISDHLNIEHVVSFDLAHISDGTGDTYNACSQFLWFLQLHLPRPTTLTPAIFNIAESPSTWTQKACCLWYLGTLYGLLSQLTEMMKAFKAAEALYLTAGEHENAAHCVTSCADIYRTQGRFIQSQQVLEDFQRSDSWEHLSESSRAEAWYILDKARMYTFTASADELFVKSLEDHNCGLQSKVWHWAAKLYYGGDIVQAKMHLENVLLQCTHLEDCKAARHVLAEAALFEGRLSEAMDNLQKIIQESDLEGRDPESVLWYGTWKGVVASKQGNYDLARDFIRKASGPFKFFELHNALTFLRISYDSAHIELTAGEYDIAESKFAATIEGCDMQDHLLYKGFSVRGLGEIAFARGNFALAAEHFAKTRSLCAEMGLPPKKFYTCFPFSALPERFEGWALFLEGQSPFTNIM